MSDPEASKRRSDGATVPANVATTLAAEDRHRVDRVEKAGVPPILVELKQVTDLHGSVRATRAAVASAIETARGEVQRYRCSLASRPQWAGIMPFIVVVHTCVEDLAEFEGDDVILIDLSATTPCG
jgi:hypothetical protein